MVLTRQLSDERMDRFESTIAGALQSLAAYTEQSQSKLPFFIERHAAQVPNADPFTLTLQPVAAQLVRITGLVVLFPPSLQNNKVTEFEVTLGDLILDLLGSGGIVLPQCTFFVKQTDVLSATVAGYSTTSDYLTYWLWGEQVPTTGMVS
jgi:hypothetical protein